MFRYVILGCSLLLVLGSGCKTKGGRECDVKGTVKLDGQPMKDGEISFILAGAPPSTMPVKDGAYSGKAKEGELRVEIRAFRTPTKKATGGTAVMEGQKSEDKENYIPDRFNGTSKLTAKVTSGGTNEFPFEVTSK